jgi:predicted transcriptional regulator
VSPKDISLTGNNVKSIRLALGESQKDFADRIAVTQPVIHRIEKKGDERLSGPEIILISQIARENNIKLLDADEDIRVECVST